MDILEAMERRHSVRRYQNKPISLPLREQLQRASETHLRVQGIQPFHREFSQSLVMLCC